MCVYARKSSQPLSVHSAANKIKNKHRNSDIQYVQMRKGAKLPTVDLRESFLNRWEMFRKNVVEWVENIVVLLLADYY